MLNKKIVYVTCFDKNYILKAMAMYFSLIRHNPSASLWVLPMDTETKRLLGKMKLKNLYLIDKKDFEDKKLLEAKKNRSRVEYIWTCTPSLPLYIFKKDKLVKYVVYIDADFFFFSGAGPAFKELRNGSIFIEKHRYSSGEKYRNERTGRFNVSFMIFKRDKEGLKCLRRWRKQCIKWCYARVEDGKFGDQLYLNEWPDLYKNLVISKNLGINAAPWNISQYDIIKEGKFVYINRDRLICYHFHQFEILGQKSFTRTHGYRLSRQIIENIYRPYEGEIEKQIRIVKKIDRSFRIVPPKKNIVDESKRRLIKFMGPLYWKVLDFLK